MDKQELYKKFDRDVAKRSRMMRFLLALDQMINVLWLNGSKINQKDIDENYQ